MYSKFTHMNMYVHHPTDPNLAPNPKNGGVWMKIYEWMSDVG